MNKETGELRMRGKIRGGDYHFSVIVYDRYWKREVQSTVTVKVREIGDDAIFNSGSIRLTGQSHLNAEYVIVPNNNADENLTHFTSMSCVSGVTAEEFVDRPKIGPGTNDYGKSKYDLFREMIARKLQVSTKNVDIFTVRNHPSLERTVDIRFSAHGSPYYRPARLDGIVNQFKMEVGLVYILQRFKVKSTSFFLCLYFLLQSDGAIITLTNLAANSILTF